MYGEGFLCLQIYCMCFYNISITCSALVCIHVSVFFVCVCLTSSVVPQDGDTPPLFHVGQLTARPEHCARTDESTEETHAVKIKQHPLSAPLQAQHTQGIFL